MAKSFVLSKVTTDLLKNEEFGGTGSWRAMGTPNGEMQSPVRLDLFLITKKASPVTFRNNKGNISGAEDQHYTARGDKFWNQSFFFPQDKFYLESVSNCKSCKQVTFSYSSMDLVVSEIPVFQSISQS